MSSLFGKKDEYILGTGIGLEYGGTGLQISREIDKHNRVYFSSIPIQPYIHAIGISSDLYFLQDTNFRTHLTYGTTTWSYSTYTQTSHSLGLSLGINYFFNKPYEGWHFGLDYVLFDKTYKYPWKSFGFSKWEKGEDSLGYGKTIAWSLGYKF
jgi:hypothetical protein